MWTDAEIESAVNRVRAGRDLNPDDWPGGSRVAVLFSFDVDNETIWLRNNDTNVGGLSQGEYGSRVSLGRGPISRDRLAVRPGEAALVGWASEGQARPS